MISADRTPLRRDRLAPGVEAAAAMPLLNETSGDLEQARAFWGLADGIIPLELNDRFPPDADLITARRKGIDSFHGTSRRGNDRTRGIRTKNVPVPARTKVARAPATPTRRLPSA